MKQLESKFKNNTLVATLEANDVLRLNIFRSILFGFGVLVLAYLFLLGSSVLNIVERKSLEVRAHDLTNHIGALELEYLQVSSSIDRELSTTMGFEEIAQNFATRKSANMMIKKLAKNEI